MSARKACSHSGSAQLFIEQRLLTDGDNHVIDPRKTEVFQVSWCSHCGAIKRTQKRNGEIKSPWIKPFVSLVPAKGAK